MAIPPLEPLVEGTSDRHPLLMEQPENANLCFENRDRQEHIIDIARVGTASTVPLGYDPNDSGELHPENMPSTSAEAPIVQAPPSLVSPNARNTGVTRRGDTYNRRHRSPLNSGWWISIELVVNMSQIVAAIAVLSMSKHEKPQTPLREWVIGYTAGCVATLPNLYWRYIHRNRQGTDQESVPAQSGSSNVIPEAVYSSATDSQAPSSGSRHDITTGSQTSERLNSTNPRFNSLVEHFKMAMDCFFAVWFVVGNVWIFGGRSSASTAPNLYRLCIVFLTFSCIGYAMPFILCATICCCLPCIITILGFREDLGQNRGATPEVINALPVYKFKMKKIKSSNKESSSDGADDGGILAAGTDKERVISNDDASCCICLAKYANNEELRELPCSHFFHKDCVDKWLKINALCPLCKFEIGEAAHPTSSNPTSHGQ